MKNNVSNRNNKTFLLVVDAMFIALVFVATWLINIRLPLVGSGGLIHMGNVPLFIAGMLFGKRTGATAGAFGMALFDLMSGWTAWAPFTFVIVGAMGYSVGLVEEKKPFKTMMANHVSAVIMAMMIKIIGYYFAEVILYGNWIAPLGSIPGNLIQVGFAGIVVLLFIEPLRRIMKVR